MEIVRKAKEVTISVLPIALFTALISLCLNVLTLSSLFSFALSTLMVIVGLTLFLTGVSIGITPSGNMIGSVITRSRSLPLLLLSSVILGVVITLPEPDLQVLAAQVVSVRNISKATLLISVAVGVGLFLSLAALKTIVSWSIKKVLAFSFLFLFVIAFFSDSSFVSIAFDSGGATTGPLSVPFIMALGMGIAATRKHKGDAEFGYVGFSSTGAVIAVLLLGLFYKSSSGSVSLAADEGFVTLLSLLSAKMKEVSISLSPLLLLLIFMQFLFLKMPLNESIRIFMGYVYSFLGMSIFFTGAEYSFSFVATQLGKVLSPHPAFLLFSGFFLGLLVVLAEPAVMVLTAQVEDESSGMIKKSVMLFCLSIGVALAVSLSLLRHLFSLSIWTLVLPVYLLILLLMIKTPSLFVAIAFDAGGVATGPMCSSFLLPFSLGAALNLNAASDSFGLIALVAALPILIVELMGVYFNKKMKEKGQEIK